MGQRGGDIGQPAGRLRLLRTLRVWDLDTGEMLAVTPLDAPVSAVAAAPNSRIVVGGDQSGRVHFFDLVEPE